MRNMTPNNSFGTLLKSLRKKRDLSIKNLSKHLNVNYTYISKMENGRSLPSKDILSKIADIFNYDKEELFIRAGKMPEDIIDILRENPKEAANFLRRNFSKNE